MRCHICGRVIPADAKYYQVKGGKEVYCEHCYNEAPRCRLCNLPTAPGDIDPETGACQRCLAKLPRCKACGKPIIGTAYTFPFASGIFCAQCKNTRPACYVCGVPVGDQYWKYPDGRIICGECGDRAVVDVSEIQRIMQDVQTTTESRLGMKIRTPYTLRVEKLGGLPRSGAGTHDPTLPDQSPLYGKELGLYRRTGNQSEIFLLFGLPPELLYETAAHEYAHAWQVEVCPFDLPPDLREGFAQWVAADVLRAKGYTNALAKLEARKDSPYGTGYQQLRRLRLQDILARMLQER